MATVSPFYMLGDDDDDDPTQLIAIQQQKILAMKSSSPVAEMPTKPLSPSQAVMEDKRNDAVHHGGGSGRGGPGRGRGGRGGGLRQSHDFVNENVSGFAESYGGAIEGGRCKEGDGGRPLVRVHGPYNGPANPSEEDAMVGMGMGRLEGIENGLGGHEWRSGTCHGHVMKREGAGRGNWGTATDDAFAQETEDNVNADEKIASPEKQPEQEDAQSVKTGKENKEGQANESEEKEKEAKEMTLEEI